MGQNHDPIEEDGGNWIEPLGQMHFPGWEQILDFLCPQEFLEARMLAQRGPIRIKSQQGDRQGRG